MRFNDKTGKWVAYNHLTDTYDTPDGTSVAAELADNVQCLSDVLRIAQIRAKQRDERPNAAMNGGTPSVR